MSHAATEPGFMAHIRSWFEKDVEPDLADLKADAKRFRQMAPALERIASVVEALAKLRFCPRIPLAYCLPRLTAVP